MNRAIRTYLRHVRRNLTCFRKRERLCRLHGALRAFAGECSAPDYPHLVEAFGPPEEMARTLMQEVPAKESSAFFRREWILKAAACALLLVSLFAGWMWHRHETTNVITYQDTYIIGPKGSIMDVWEAYP